MTVLLIDNPIAVSIVAPLPGVITGTTVIAGAPDVPVARRVELFQAENAHGMLFPHNNTVLGWQWSAPDGSYTFRGLDPAQQYGIVAHDHTGVHDPVIKLNLTPEVLE